MRIKLNHKAFSFVDRELRNNSLVGVNKVSNVVHFQNCENRRDSSLVVLISAIHSDAIVTVGKI